MCGPIEWSRATGSIHAASPVAYRLYDGKLVGRAASHDGITCKPKTCSATGRHYILAEKKAFCLGEVVDVRVWEKEKKKREKQADRESSSSKQTYRGVLRLCCYSSRPAFKAHYFDTHISCSLRIVIPPNHVDHAVCQSNRI